MIVLWSEKQAYKIKYQGPPPQINYVTADRLYTLLVALKFVLAYNNGLIRKVYHKKVFMLQDLFIQNYANNCLHIGFPPSSEIFMCWHDVSILQNQLVSISKCHTHVAPNLCFSRTAKHPLCKSFINFFTFKESTKNLPVIGYPTWTRSYKVMVLTLRVHCISTYAGYSD